MFELKSTTSFLLAAFVAIVGMGQISSHAQLPLVALSAPHPVSIVSSRPPDSCPVTQPPSEPFVPPAPYPSELRTGQFWFGSEKLWTWRPIDAVLRGQNVVNAKSGKTHELYRDKVFWWRKGYDWRTENPPKLRISGKRLDGPARAIRVDGPGAAFMKNPAMVAAFEVPTAGCWAITANYKGDKLTYVVWVTR
jgi:hypothetical protein